MHDVSRESLFGLFFFSLGAYKYKIMILFRCDRIYS